VQNIDWETDKEEIRLVVEGSFTSTKKQHEVMLTYMKNLMDTSSIEGVRGANLYITDGENTYLLEEVDSIAGLYQTIDEVQGYPGKTYTLDIKLKEKIGGYSHYSASEQMYEPMRMDSIKPYLSKENPFEVSISIGDDNDSTIAYLSIYTYGQEPITKGNYYIFNIYRNEMLVTKEITDVIQDQDLMTNGDTVFFHLYEGNFDKDDNIRYECKSISEKYYEYISGVVDETSGADPLGMGAPPANVWGNISNRALGYFAVCSESSVTNKIKIDD